MACLHEKELWDNRWCPATCFYCTGDQKRRCKNNKATNADRIRAMNDEELAKEMRSHAFALATCSEKAWLEWLQSPAE